ncbi:RraA family protein [Puniceibacterium sp. IMCC21224]|uniref:RraA family protein n=1 Tax=Puniceibacterium sp. IMCC21224 TaxID=1618204 RepID=UPI00064DC941|nr:RraA family protein [Puniceibacterium sp. IMCC21224]KMK69072.1 Demethylmenaquinone methyltransferase [Puniceibacterium sp. IMCC21224]
MNLLDSKHIPRIEPDLVAAYGTLATSLISDILDRLTGLCGLRPYHAGGRMVGTALTVKTREGDNKAIHDALEIAQPGDVIVVDGAGDVTRALIGEIVAERGLAIGVAGFVVDGAIRDVETIARMDIPCYARSVSHLGPYKTGPGRINQPIACGGSVVNPGDLVVGDADGVIALSPATARRIIDDVRALEAAEITKIADLRNRS